MERRTVADHDVAEGKGLKRSQKGSHLRMSYLHEKQRDRQRQRQRQSESESESESERESP